MKNAIYIQSGGPTAVINASAYGVIDACRNNKDRIGTLYAAEHGILGLIHDRLVDIGQEDEAQLALLRQTPSSVFGSCRYRVPDAHRDDSDYRKILATLERHNIGYIFYNGGNGTLRACRDLLTYLEGAGYPVQVVAIPKTVDNDIAGLDHAPGFPSAARHVAITVSELAHDIRVYDTGLITVLEVMGRGAGWLAASTLLCAEDGNGPDLIYTPEITFDSNKFVQDVGEVYTRQGKALVVVAEGVRTGAGKYLFELDNQVFDGAPQLHMGGVTPYLTELLRQHFPCKIRGIDLGLMQRCGMHTASQLDIQEAVELGAAAVHAALQGASGKMVALERTGNAPYTTRQVLMDLDQVTAEDGFMPREYINQEGNYIRPAFLEYIRPLVGPLPRYAKLRLEVCHTTNSTSAN